MDAAMIRAESVVQHIHESLTTPFVVAGTELYISASMGISLFPQDGDESGGLLRNAEAAMYREQEVRSGRLRRVGAAAPFDSSAKLQFVTQAPQGRRAPAMGPALPTGDRARDGSDDRRRGADPLDRARRHHDPAGRFHPARRGARADRDDRRLGGERGRLPIACVARTWASTSRSASTCRLGSSGSPTWRSGSSRRSAAAASTRPRSSSR